VTGGSDDNTKSRVMQEIHISTRVLLTCYECGCILVGDGMRDMNGDTIPDVTNSLVTLQKLMANISSTGTLKIRLATKAFGVYK
jgi:hypothetical protein